MGDGRALDLARDAVAFAARAGVTLPDDLALWQIAGGRPRPAAGGGVGGGFDPAPGPAGRSAMARALVDALEARLTPTERTRGAHYTPAALAEEIAAAVVGDGGGTVVDPACGGGALLLAAAERMAAGGADPAWVARERLFGADIDPLAVAVAEAAMALWSGGTAPAVGHLVVADVLRAGRSAWSRGPAGGFGAVVGNPPFQGQLATATARDGATRRALRARFGAAVSGYTDTAAVFLLAALELAAPGARVALVQPLSTAASRDAGPVRGEVARRAVLVDLLVPSGRPFAANVHVCVPVLEVGRVELAGSSDGEWAARLAGATGVPLIELASAVGVVGDLATVVAGFRRHYYGLVGHVREDDGGGGAPLVTSGLVELGRCAWGERPARFARQRWSRPVADVDGACAGSEALARWFDVVLRPKVVVATQTRVLEAAADRAGCWVPSTPLVAVVPADPADVERVAAVLCAPPVSAWAAARVAGTGRAPGTLRVSAPLVRSVPLPVDGAAWSEAAAQLVAGDLARFAVAATAMYALPSRTAAATLTWWTETGLGPARGLR